MKFYTFTQNNSGGSFVNDTQSGLGHFTIIEAENAKQANIIAQSIGIYFDGCDKDLDCSCCGDRWYEVDENDGYDEPKIYYKKASEHYDMFNAGCYIHYQNGKIESIDTYKNKEK